MAGQSLVFDFASRGADQLAGDFTRTGSAAGLAAKGARLCADALAAQERAGKAAATGLQAAERASALLAVTERELDKEIEKANRALVAQDVAAKAAGKSADGARGGFARLAGEVTGFGAAADAASSGGNKLKLAMAAVNLASGVLQPVLAGVVVAAGGLASGLAAAGAGLGVFGVVAKTVFAEASKAATAYAAAQQKMTLATTPAQRTAALKAEQAAMYGLSPPVKALAIELGNVQKMWKAFTDAAAPGVVGVISAGLGLLPKILAAMKPFLAPVETALRGIIGHLNTGLSSAGFKSFTDLLATNTGPAITKIAAAIGNIIVGIGGILRAFMPVSQSMLGGIDKITAKFREWGTTLSSGTGFQSLMATFRKETPQAVEILKNLGAVLANVGKAVFGLSTFSNSRLLLSALLPLSGVMASLSKNTDLVRVALYALAAVKIGQQFSWVTDAWKGIVKFAAAAEGATVAETIAAAATRAWGLAMTALPWVALAAAVVAVAVLIIKYHTQIWAFMQRVWHDILVVIMGVWDWVRTHWPLLLGIITGPVGLAILWIVQHFGQITAAVQAVLSAVSKAWNTAWNTLKAAFRIFVVDGILGPLGLIVNGAAAAFGWVPGLGGKLKAAARAFNTFRDGVNAALGGINGRTVNVSVAMTSATNPYPGGISGRKAAGGLITTGTGSTADDVLILVSRGELVVPAHLVKAGAVDHLRGRLPGFASGGPVGVNVAAHAPTLAQVEASLMASVMKLAVVFAKAAQAAAAAVGSIGNYKPGAGVQQWRGVTNTALSQAGSPVSLADAVLYQMQTESGGNPRAVNRTDSNWLAGHPSVGLMQVIRGTFQAYAGRYRGTGPFEYGVSENPLANIYSAIRYAQVAYGPNLRNSRGGIGSGHGYDRGGPLMPGLTLAWNGTGRPEQVIPGDGLDALAGELRALRGQMAELIRTTAAVPAATGRHVAAGVNGASADAVFRGRYPGR